tara:strand:- start:683 stop:823 length:141 start_codon:yes stop_codon:yes gene_type:complete
MSIQEEALPFLEDKIEKRPVRRACFWLPRLQVFIQLEFLLMKKKFT